MFHSLFPLSLPHEHQLCIHVLELCASVAHCCSIYVLLWSPQVTVKQVQVNSGGGWSINLSQLSLPAFLFTSRREGGTSCQLLLPPPPPISREEDREGERTRVSWLRLSGVLAPSTVGLPAFCPIGGHQPPPGT